MADTHITDEHRRAFDALTSGQYQNFCLFSCSCNGHPAVAIAAVNVCPAKKAARTNTRSRQCSSASTPR